MEFTIALRMLALLYLASPLSIKRNITYRLYISQGILSLTGEGEGQGKGEGEKNTRWYKKRVDWDLELERN